MKPLAFAAFLLLPAVIGSNASRDAETTRIRTRLASVEQQLRRTDVSKLTPAQRAARARNLDVLHAYWVRGVFPKNTDFPGERMPYFVDRYGTRCAMAYLIEQSGHGDLVARVAATNNNARIRELKSDPELVAWLRDNGLTAAEAAHIQPEYGPPPLPVEPSPVKASQGYKTTTGVAVGLNATTVVLNAAQVGFGSRANGVLGIATGAAGMAAGMSNLGRSGQRLDLGLLNTGIGAASVVLGAYRFAGASRAQPRASLAPWVGAADSPGFALHVTF